MSIDLKPHVWTLTALVVAVTACQPNSGNPGADPAPAIPPPAPCVAMDAGDGVPTAPAERWPSFRGQQASGVSASPDLPTHWDGSQGLNIKWRAAIPGLGLSSPVVWGERLFLTTAVGEGEAVLSTDFSGETDSQPDEGPQEFRLLCLDAATGAVLWQRTAHAGEPKTRRHPMSSHANPSPATDGRHVVAFFGSEGLYTYDVDGQLLWQKDLGLLEASWFANPEDEWGFASSPIIVDDRVIVVCDVNNQSFIAAFALADGTELWRSERDEVPGWGSPTVADHAGRTQVIVNGFKHIGGYDVSDGRELWRMTGGGDIPVPTPVLGHGLVFLTNSHGRSSPILAVGLDAEGDVSLAQGTTSNQHVRWSEPRRGAYMPTPIVYGDHLYVGRDFGILTVYRATTGEEVYRERIGDSRASFVASAVAGCGRVYYTDETCTTHVIAAGESYRLVASNSIPGACLASPAIAGSTLFLRTGTELYAIADNTRSEARPTPIVAEEEPAEDRYAAELATETDPARTLLLRSAVALTAVDAVRYRVEVVGTDDASGQQPPLSATVIASGYTEGLPDYFRITGTVGETGSDSAVAISAGSDGYHFYVIDHSTETVHADLETAVFGQLGWTAFQGLVTDFVDNSPLGFELEGSAFALGDPVTIDGEQCQVVETTFDDGYLFASTLVIASGDLLPRVVHRVYRGRDDARWGLRQTITGLEVEPELTAADLALVVPDGYRRSDERSP